MREGDLISKRGRSRATSILRLECRNEEIEIRKGPSDSNSLRKKDARTIRDTADRTVRYIRGRPVSFSLQVVNYH